ncbi:hypothetical protein RhiirA5_349682 [Rhizophagus irregularis]|uniref:Uncharacterized protein n=1 Tax=Rhizophagus irregularis TaxID=588596 RepID=A0A2I1E2G2_9GLOM|nr:hypothetical protein RhiirA5_349682 [Rhizophagus irregularis]PKY16291.1 hypothetical protein RhiirB3_402691 [Rhizophagus irregularis]
MGESSILASSKRDRTSTTDSRKEMAIRNMRINNVGILAALIPIIGHRSDQFILHIGYRPSTDNLTLYPITFIYNYSKKFILYYLITFHT